MRKKYINSEGGFASLVVALTLIIVMALITVGFAQLSRREQQNTLTKQLAMDAYNAAETGVNDAYDYYVKHGHNVPAGADTTCQTVPGYSTSIDSTYAVGYSCVLINDHPNKLVWTGVQPDEENSSSFTVSGSGQMALTVQWDSEKTNLPTTLGDFKTLSNWDYPAVIDFSITPLTSFKRDDLKNNTFHAYLYPMSGGTNSVTYNPSGNQGAIVNSPCADKSATNTQKRCSVTIGSIPQSAGGYLIHFVNLYNKSDIQMFGVNGGGNVQFKGAQTIIDATGKARDVLKRLQIVVKVDPTSNFGPYTIEAQSVCKRLSAKPTGTDYIETNGGTNVAGQPCYLE